MHTGACGRRQPDVQSRTVHWVQQGRDAVSRRPLPVIFRRCERLRSRGGRRHDSAEAVVGGAGGWRSRLCRDSRHGGQRGRAHPGDFIAQRAAQEALVPRGLPRCRRQPGRVRYVEAHGTGTAVGDPIEAQALGAVLSLDREAGDYCLDGLGQDQPRASGKRGRDAWHHQGGAGAQEPCRPAQPSFRETESQH